MRTTRAMAAAASATVAGERAGAAVVVVAAPAAEAEAAAEVKVEVKMERVKAEAVSSSPPTQASPSDPSSFVVKQEKVSPPKSEPQPVSPVDPDAEFAFGTLCFPHSSVVVH